MEVISLDLTAFVLFRFILDNVLLIHEMLDWAKRFRQLIIFLKLDFSKAYDKVNWEFLLKALEKLGMSTQVVSMIKLLFSNACVAMNFNDQLVTNFVGV
jgi:hypothetical protein